MNDLRNATLWMALLLTGPATADGNADRMRIPIPSLHDLDRDARGTSIEDLRREGREVHLALDEVVALAMERNLDLMVERYRHQVVLLGVQRSRGIFDLELDGSAGFDEDTRPTGSVLEDADLLVSEGQRFDFGLSQLSTLGGTARFQFNTARNESSDRRVDPNPVFNVGMNLSYAQPLLRGFGRRNTRSNLIVARRNAEISREDFQEQVEGLFIEVSNAYWDLVEQREQLKVAEETLRYAEELHELNGLKLEAGVLAPIEMVQSEATVASRRVRELEAAALGIESARIARELAEKNLEAVRLGYEHGSKSTLDVNIVQEDLSQSRSVEINAILSYRRTAIAFYRSIGRLLDHHGIVLADAGDRSPQAAH